MPKHARVEVVQQAIIVNPLGQVLLLRRPEGVWQFAGGRLNSDERWEDGLHREIREETGILDIEVAKILLVDNFAWNDIPLYSVYFFCRTGSSEVILSHEHDQYRWVGRGDNLGEINFWHPTLKILVERVFEEQSPSCT
jgi:8-oxo-dGTP diphosphatase